MKTSKTAALALAHFKQLCCLGLPGQQVMPTLLAALHEVVPSYANYFFWIDAHGKLSNVLFENLDEVVNLMPLYLGEFADTREREVVSSAAESLRTRRGVWTVSESLKVDRRTYHRHDFYQLLMRPSGFHDGLRAAVCDGARPLGIMGLGRKEAEVGFTRRDMRMLAALLPFLGHALTVPADTSVHYTEGQDEGMLIVDESSRICYQSAQARKLIFYATHPRVDGSTLSSLAGKEALRSGLAMLVQRLKASTAASADIEARPPVWRHGNHWGEFVFRAYWMDAAGAAGYSDVGDAAPEPGGMIAISVRHNEPVALKLQRELQDQPLSPRQQEVGLWLAQGASFPQIAKQLGLSKRTVENHANNIYTKLNVTNRVELAGKLLL